MTRVATLCTELMLIVALPGCAAQQQHIPTGPRSVNQIPTMRLYDETAYYNAVKNRWFGLGDYAIDQPGR